MSAVLTQLLLLQLGCIFISVQAKASSVSCPSGQFAFKNRCVFCHPTCAECEGHELFQCTACGSGMLCIFKMDSVAGG
ncbi:proprotein convertase subtilisin/kexin type 5 isoform X1 [Tachysurus ichikawai]